MPCKAITIKGPTVQNTQKATFCLLAFDTLLATDDHAWAKASGSAQFYLGPYNTFNHKPKDNFLPVVSTRFLVGPRSLHQ